VPFRFHPLRFNFVARESIYFPPGKSANILRGAFGSIFRRIACVPECAGAASCELRATCPYAQMFEPSSPGAPSGFVDLPRPFVFRAWHLDGRTIDADVAFHFDLNLFDIRNPAIAYLVLAFAQLGREGLGPQRRPVELTSVWQLGLDGQPQTKLFDGTSLHGVQPTPQGLDLDRPQESVRAVRLHFVTPTELKAGEGIATQPEFGVLAARIRDRLSILGQAYGEGPLAIDFKAFGERALVVRMTRCTVHQVDVDRRSSRTGRIHSIGGFVGEAEYEGKLGEFVPYLRAAKWTGVGRQTVWGKGEVECLTLCSLR
jgi:hypothetical protein